MSSDQKTAAPLNNVGFPVDLFQGDVLRGVACVSGAAVRAQCVFIARP
jgi:hypothetical protein